MQNFIERTCSDVFCLKQYQIPQTLPSQLAQALDQYDQRVLHRPKIRDLSNIISGMIDYR